VTAGFIDNANTSHTTRSIGAVRTGNPYIQKTDWGGRPLMQQFELKRLVIETGSAERHLRK